MDENFNVTGRWEASLGEMKYNYDFWYQPRHNVMVSSEFGAPNAYYPGFKLEDVQAGRYGQKLYFWDFAKREIAQTFDLGADGLIPLEVRFHHDPASSHGYCGVALSSNVYHWHKNGPGWEMNKVIQGEPVEVEGWPFPVPPLITDILLSMDDRYMYFSNWLHGDVRQYDISDPANPRLAGQVWLGGVLGKAPRSTAARSPAAPRCSSSPSTASASTAPPRSSRTGQPVLSQDGRAGLMHGPDRLRHGWGRVEDQPGLLRGLRQGAEGPARAHEMRYPGGDCTSDIWLVIM
jgi:selenium-binding protein 1